jgi:hypothetical protein
LFFRNVLPVMAPAARLVITHAHWLDPAAFATGPLRIERLLDGPDDLEPGLDIEAWGFSPPPEGQMFPIAVLARR